jgi:hypothetical protein
VLKDLLRGVIFKEGRPTCQGATIYRSPVRGLPRLPTTPPTHQSNTSRGFRGGARPPRQSYFDQQWRTQYVIGERIQYNCPHMFQVAYKNLGNCLRSEDQMTRQKERCRKISNFDLLRIVTTMTRVLTASSLRDKLLKANAYVHN